MEFDEALEILGLTELGTADGVRRAYLRRIRNFKPEQDPAGFLKLREAYETLHALSQELFVRHVSHSLEHDLSVPDIDQIPPATPIGCNTVAPKLPLGARRSPPPDPNRAEVQRRLEHLAILDPVRQAPARLNLLRDTVRDFPADETARWALVQELLRTEALDAAGSALRSAIDNGLPQFLDQLAAYYPELLKPHEIDCLATSQDPDHRIQAAISTLISGDSDRGIEQIRELLATDGFDGSTGLNRTHVINSIVALIECGHFDKAQELFRDLPRWRFDGQLNLGVSPVSEIAAAELLNLPGDFPAEVRRLIARAVRRGDLVSATDDLLEFASHDQRAANRASKMLVTSAPLLGHTYENLLTSEPIVSGGNGTSSGLPTAIGRAGVILAIIFAMNVIRSCNESAHYSVNRNQIRGLETLSLPQASLFEIVCGESSLQPNDPMCMTIRETNAAIDEADCELARAALERIGLLARQPQHLSESKLDPMTKRTLWANLEVAVRSACASEPTPSPGGQP